MLFFIACSDENRLTFEPNEIVWDNCNDCPLISISVPNVVEKSKIGQNINNAIAEEIISILIYDEQTQITSITDALESFKKGFTDLNELYTDEGESWEANITGEVTYEDKNTLTISLDSYLFTGGAHGYSTKRFLNFNKKTGLEFEHWQLFTNRDDFRKFVEAKFRQQERIPDDKPINHTGFMFEKDSFYLPENIGFTQKGIQLLYNQYEVASYADGPIELVLPYSEVKKFLRPKIKSGSLISTTSFED